MPFQDAPASDYYSAPYGNLYESHAGKLDADARVIYEQFIDTLEQLISQANDTEKREGEGRAWEIWDRGIKALYNEIVIDTFKRTHHLIEDMELYFAGSNAKSQGTFYSDVDAFVVFPEGTPDDEIEKAREVFKKVNTICHRIFIEKNQLYPDPLGINPAQLCGTPKGLLALISDPELVLDQGPIVTSIMSSRPITGRWEQGQQLRGMIEKNRELRAFFNARTFYNKAINDFTAPRPEATEIHIKRHITRPLDFILMGLRTEFGLDDGDGQILSAEQTLLALHDDSLLPVEQITVLSRAHQRATKLRFETHHAAGRESDNVSINTEGVRELLADVETLREIFRPRLETLNADTVTGHPSPAPAPPPKSKGLSSRTKWRIGALIMMGIGIAIGAALCATGVFAPFGIGVLGIVAMGTGGAGAGLLGTGLAKAGTILATARKRPKGYKSVPIQDPNTITSYGQMDSIMPRGEEASSSSSQAGAVYASPLASQTADDLKGQEDSEQDVFQQRPK